MKVITTLNDRLNRSHRDHKRKSFLSFMVLFNKYLSSTGTLINFGKTAEQNTSKSTSKVKF